jgi:DNA-binding protein YbaB
MVDIFGMMKQAQQLQSKMQEMQDQLAKMDVKGVKIDPSLMKAEEREVLEDLLVTAFGDARRKAEAAMQEKMQALTGGLSLPPGMFGQ